MEREEIKSIIESLLFVADGPVTIQRLGEALEGVEKDLRQSVEEGLRCAALAGAGRADAGRWLGRGL